MMSKNSSSTMKPLSRRSVMREITRRRLWVVVFTAIPLLFLYPFGTLMILSASRRAGQYAFYGFADAKEYLAYSVANYIGSNTFAILAVAFLALLIGLQGFAYLFSAQQVDFFESQPMSRRQRFFRIFVHGLTVFVAAYLTSILLTALIAISTGAFNETVRFELLFVLIRDLTLFFAVYAIAVLAAMLTGSLIYAIGMSLFLLLIQYIARAVTVDYMSQFFRTFASQDTEIAAPFSVIWHLAKIMEGHGAYDYYARMDDVYGQRTVAAYYARLFTGNAPHLAMLLAVGVIVTVLAFLAYKKRKAESAGATVIYDPLYVLIKFLLSVIGGMAFGSLLRIFYYGYGYETESFFRLAVVALVFSALIAVFLEAMYRRSVGGAMKRLFHVPVVMSLTYIVLLLFRMDVIGYDRFVPMEDKVESYALYLTYSNYYFNSGRDYIDESGTNYLTEKEFIEKYMYLTDIDAIADLVLLDREAYENMPEDRYSPEGHDCIVLYRMKNGKKKYRTITIPYDADDALMERVVGSDPYKTGSQQVCHDQAIDDDYLAGAKLTFDTGFRQFTEDGTLYQDFASCYRADLAGLTYDELKNEQALGYVMLIYPVQSPYSLNRALPFAVYPSFTETIAFLKAHDMYAEVDPDASLIDTVEIEYYVKSNREEEGIYGDYETVFFEDEEEVRQIMDAFVYDRLISGWYDFSGVDQGTVIVRRVNFHTKAGDADAWFDKDRVDDYGFAGRLMVIERMPEALSEKLR